MTAAQPRIEKLQFKIGGMSCSFCVASISKAVGRMPGVHRASVNLAHEEALVEYDSSRVEPTEIKQTLLELGYTVRDAKKVRTFEEEEAEVRRERAEYVGADHARSTRQTKPLSPRSKCSFSSIHRWSPLAIWFHPPDQKSRAVALSFFR